jgi:hypothetical protein
MPDAPLSICFLVAINPAFTPSRYRTGLVGREKMRSSAVPRYLEEAKQALRAAYPHAPAILRHGLTAEPLLGLAELARAADELAPEWVERRVHNARNGEAFTLLGHGEAAAALASQGPAEQWIMLRFIERLPRYRALLDNLIAELGTAISHTTGAPSGIKGFVFVSAPHTHTPFHFDAEFNILFQIAGTKTFATYPPRPPFLSLAAREAYHVSGDNMLGWHEEYAAAAALHHLTPGDGLFVPHGAPHWVKVGAEPSISLSLTWQNAWSEAVADALALNPLMRRLGLPLSDPAVMGARAPHWRALMGKLAQRAGAL